MSPQTKTALPAEPVDSAERRGSIRYQITVAAEVIELKSGTQFSTRTTDLGPGGCFVDTLMPLPVGSQVRVHLHKENVSFETLGTVTFSQTGLGMGVAFNEMPREKQSALDAWLALLINTKPAGFEASRAHIPTDDSHVLVKRLIQLLVKRQVISAADAATLLRENLP